MVVTISYVLFVIVGWNAWRQLHDSLATRIRAITMQLRLGIADEAAPTLSADGHELKDLADSVSNYIRQTLDQQQSNEERYRRLIELAPDGVLICSDAGVRFANPAAVALAGVKRRLELIGLPIDRFLEFENAESAGHPTDGGLRPALWRRVSGEQLHVEVAEVSYMDSGVSIRQYVVRDVTSRRAREAALAHRAEHDSLTGLVNRARFQARLADILLPRSVPVEPADARQAAVLFIDLDGFKPINDRAGHAAGDAVLVAVAARLRESTRGTDLVARFGGDEFAVLIEVRDANGSSHGRKANSSLATTADSLREQLAQRSRQHRHRQQHRPVASRGRTSRRQSTAPRRPPTCFEPPTSRCTSRRQTAAIATRTRASGRNRPTKIRTLTFTRWPNHVETHGDNDAGRT